MALSNGNQDQPRIDHNYARRYFVERYNRKYNMHAFDNHARYFFKHPPGLYRVLDNFNYSFTEPPYRGSYVYLLWTDRTYIIVYSHLFWPEQHITSIKFLHNGKAFVGYFPAWCSLNRLLKHVD